VSCSLPSPRYSIYFSLSLSSSLRHLYTYLRFACNHSFLYFSSLLSFFLPLLIPHSSFLPIYSFIHFIPSFFALSEGLKCLEKAAEEDKDLVFFFGDTLRRISEAYFALINYEEAEKYALKALDYHKGGKNEPATVQEIIDRRYIF
jgi:tetratricopeptide (TPR) repeat protein